VRAVAILIRRTTRFEEGAVHQLDVKRGVVDRLGNPTRLGAAAAGSL
jgi:hypothetical protein